jgi:gamma-glutamyltranspeptidase/glutathione hydrolase
MKEGRPWVALGTPGGHTIGQTVPQMIMNVVDFGMDIQQALAAGRISFVEPDQLAVEPSIPEPVRRELAARGHQVKPATALGNAHGLTIEYDPTGKPIRFQGGSDPRGQGSALGY